MGTLPLLFLGTPHALKGEYSQKHLAAYWSDTSTMDAYAATTSRILAHISSESGLRLSRTLASTTYFQDYARTRSSFFLAMMNCARSKKQVICALYTPLGELIFADRGIALPTSFGVKDVTSIVKPRLSKSSRAPDAVYQIHTINHLPIPADHADAKYIRACRRAARKQAISGRKRT